MISFELVGTIKEVIKFLDSVRLCSLAVSLGAVETLIQAPALMTHSHLSKEEKSKAGISNTLIRISVGIEDIQDIIQDLSQALEKI